MKKEEEEGRKKGGRKTAFGKTNRKPVPPLSLPFQSSGENNIFPSLYSKIFMETSFNFHSLFFLSSIPLFLPSILPSIPFHLRRIGIIIFLHSFQMKISFHSLPHFFIIPLPYSISFQSIPPSSNPNPIFLSPTFLCDGGATPSVRLLLID